MELLALLLPFVMLFKPSWSIQCYACAPERTPYISTLPLCEHFNYSRPFEHDCKSSTMCYKKITYLNLGNGLTTVGVQRGCAPQTLSGDQQKINGKWILVNNIYEVYDEACTEDTTNADRVTKTTHCYCRGDFCNSAHRTTTFGVFSILLGLLIMS